MVRHHRGAIAITAMVLLSAACTGGDGGSEETGGGGAASGETIEVAATWTGPEQDRFEKVLDGFAQQSGAEVRFLSAGDDIAAFVGPRIEGGDPPDVAMLPQPGVLKSFAEQGDLIPIEDVAGDEIDKNFSETARQVGSADDGTLYGVWFKTAQKSTVWYNTKVFADAGVEPPATWDELLKTGQTISDSGVEPYSYGGADGWPLSDLFENIYLRTAGPEKYDQLAAHEIPWTDRSVKEALTTMADVLESDKLAGGASGTLQTDFNTSVTQAFSDPPTGAIVFEGDFVGGIISGTTDATLGQDADFFDFPSIDGSKNVVLGGGDIAVLLKDSEGGKALIEYLATPEAAEIWAAEGGYISPNTQVDLSAYPDELSRRAAEALAKAGDDVRYDLSDLQPTEFGATTGQGIWGIFQEFVRDPSDVDGTAQKLEAAAKQAYS